MSESLNCDYNLLVKNKVKSLILWVVAFSLASVLVGGFLSFHLEYDSNLVKISNQDAGQGTELHSLDDSANPGHSHENNFDPCSQGHCHLGHCAVVLMPQIQALADHPHYLVIYNSKEFNFLSRYLESPFQPPRLS